jgi:hypothetical protein
MVNHFKGRERKRHTVEYFKLRNMYCLIFFVSKSMWFVQVAVQARIGLNRVLWENLGERDH